MKPASSRNQLDAHHIFPQALLKKDGKSSDEINDIANLTFLTEETNKKIGKKPPAEYLPGVDDELLKPHLIPMDRGLWELERYQDFLAKRREMIVKEINRFLKVEDFEKEFE